MHSFIFSFLCARVSYFAGAEPVTKLSKWLCQHYVRKLFHTSETKRSPGLPKVFIPPVLVIHRDQYTKTETTAVADCILSGDIDKLNTTAGLHNQSIPGSLQKILDNSRHKITRDLTNILNTLEKCEHPKFMLIEGGPGMGKSALLNEIAYRWSKKEVLTSYKLVFLMHLGNPAIQNASDINDMVQLFVNKSTETMEIVSACSEYLLQSNGEDIVFLVDGYDENPAALQKSNLIVDILQCRVLPDSTLIVASRAHASLLLRQQATITVDIMGYTEQEKMDFIQQALDGHPHKSEKVNQYLKTHSKINSLCYIPFYMSLLIFLYNQEGDLPSNPSELYESFVRFTILRHIVKYSNSHENIDLNNLPNPYNLILQYLCKLSLEALNNNNVNKLTTYDKIKAECPAIESFPEAVNGLGFLQAVRHCHYKKETTHCYFLHPSIPEFLANHYIANLADEELKIFKDTLCSDETFDSYVALTKGQQPLLKQFLTYENYVTIVNQILDSPLIGIHLFCRFYVAGNIKICKYIENSHVFNNKTIDLRRVRLQPINMECLAFFLIHSTQRAWLKLDLCHCCIQDNGLQILHQRLKNCDSITIAKLYLSSNGLTAKSSAALYDMIIRFKVKKLGISDNGNIGNDDTFCTIIANPSAMLETMDISWTKLSNKFFIALGKTKTLRELWITDNNITKKARRAVVKGIRRNSSLTKLAIFHNPILETHRQQIVEALCHNTPEQHIRILL